MSTTDIRPPQAIRRTDGHYNAQYCCGTLGPFDKEYIAKRVAERLGERCPKHGTGVKA